MNPHTPFLIAIGDLPAESMSRISNALSLAWGWRLIEISFKQSPNETIGSLPPEGALVQFVGDVAMMHPSGGSWLESLGAWKIPVVLVVLSNSSGEVPGIASSYVALCKELSVPLIGIVQSGEPWISSERKLDGLPWCGFLPSDLLVENSSNESIFQLENLVERLKLQFKYILKSHSL